MIKDLAYKIAALFLVLVLLTNNITTLTIVVGYIANQDFIAKNLCIQKENQQGCNGKCYLKKELAKSNTDSNNQLPLQENKKMRLDIYCLFANTNSNIQLREIILPKVSLFYDTSRISNVSLKVETPPPIFN